jgi:hypothetical protein
MAMVSTTAEAQSIADGLSKLLTQQTPPPPGYVRDQSAAQATFATVAGLFKAELASIPAASSSGGFVYRFNPAFGTAERSSESFGPFFSERVLRDGRGHLSLGLAYQMADFSTLQGADLTSGAFPTNAARFAGKLDPFSVDTLTLKLEESTVTGFASYGITDRLDVGAVVPVIRLRFSGQRVNKFLSQTTLQSDQAGSATGLGDVALNARFRLMGSAGSGLAVGTDVRLPTGREDDLLGGGKTQWRFLGIASAERGIVAVHANGGFGLGGVSREQFVSGAVTVAASAKMSLVAELIDRRLTGLYSVSDVYEPHPVVAGVETMRWLPSQTGVRTAYFVSGAKWNVLGNWLLNAEVLTRLTDTGLKARFTPSISFNYALGF